MLFVLEFFFFDQKMIDGDNERKIKVKNEKMSSQLSTLKNKN